MTWQELLVEDYSCALQEKAQLLQVYLSHSVFNVVWQKSIPAQIRKLFLYMRNSQG